MRDQYSRRRFIEQMFSIGSVSLSTGFWEISCQSETSSGKVTSTDPCQDFSNVSEKDLQTRKKLGYVNQSPRPESKCGNCNLWLPPKEGLACGSCMLFKGPVYTTGYCTYWVPQSK